MEEIFGWLKTVGCIGKTRFIGQAKTQMAAFIPGAGYNLLTFRPKAKAIRGRKAFP